MVIDLGEGPYREFACEYPRGSAIFKEGDPGNLVYLIQKGKVEISKSVGTKSKILAVLSDGEFFGEMALISEKPRSASALAVEDCKLLAMDQEMFFKILRNDYDVTLQIIKQLAARLADSDRKLEMLLFTDTTTRLVRFFEGTTSDSLPFGLSQLAYELGVPQERLQRITDKLAAKGILKIQPENLTILDRGKLSKLKNYLFLKEEFGHIE